MAHTPLSSNKFTLPLSPFTFRPQNWFKSITWHFKPSILDFIGMFVLQLLADGRRKDLSALCSLLQWWPHNDITYQLTSSTRLQQWGPQDAADKPGFRSWTSNCRTVGRISSSVVFQRLRGFSCWYWTLKRTTGRLSLFTGIDHSTSTELSDFFVTVGRDGGIRCTA